MAVRAKPSAALKAAPAAAPARARATPAPAPAGPARDPVSLLMQPKLTVNAPDDAYEREADSVAARIMQMPEGDHRRRRIREGPDGGTVRRAAEENGAQTAAVQRQDSGEDEEAQAVPLQRETPEDEDLQTARLQRETDEEEAQATPLQREKEEDDEAQTTALQREEEEDEAQTAALQREAADDEEMQTGCADCARDRRDRPGADDQPVQRQDDDTEESMQQQAEEGEDAVQARAAAAPAGRRRMSGRFEARLQHLKSVGGSPMPPGLRSFMESRFGHGFGHVRVHTGENAARLSREACARAFTVGRHIVFNTDQFRPDSDAGRRLMAHELTHVLQQEGGLHSVQREIFAPERTAAAKTPRGEELLRRLERILGIGDGQLPPAVTTIIREMLRSAANGSEAESLGGLLPDSAVAAEARRVIRNADYVLRLSVRRSERASRSEWELTRAGEDAPIFSHMVETGGSASVPAGGVDEAQIAIVDALPPKYRSDPDVVPKAEAPSGRPDREAEVSNPPEPAPQTVEGVDTSGLAGPEDAGGQPETAENAAGRGDSAGDDAPEVPRPPIDEESSSEPEEIPAPDAAELRRAARPGAPGEIGPGAERELRAALSSPGTALPAPIAAQMGADLGHDFTGVRVRTGPTAARAASELGAHAFALGDDLVFGDGQFRPDTRSGRALIAHELTHVRQFREGRGGALLRRDEECPPTEPVPEIEVVPSPASAAEDPAFSAMEGRTENRAASQATHGSGESKSTDANAAAEVTDGENRTQAQSDQVGTIATEAANPPTFDREAFIESVLAEVERIAPDTMNDVMEFKNRNTAGRVKNAVDSEAAGAADDSQSPLNEAATEDPGPGQSPRTTQPLEVEPPGPRPGSVRADRAMPPPRTESEVDMRADAIRTENILREACITRSYMDEHSDPELGAAATAQDSLAEATEAAPTSYREQEAAALTASRAGASQAGAAGVGNMFEARAGNFAGVGNAQGQTAVENARKRQELAAEVNTIFTDTQSKVTARLDTMTTEVTTTFDADATAAVNTFEEFIRVNAERYENNWFEDLVERASNWLLGPPPQEVWDFYAEGRRQFIADMRTAIGAVADIVATGLREARELVDEGKRQVEEKIAALGDDLAEFRSDIADQMNERFSGLESDIAGRQQTIVQGLGQRYARAVEELRTIEQQVRDEYSTWVDAAADAYNAAVDFVTGWIERLTAIVGDAASRIIREPGKFLRNLGAGIVQGLTMFMDNIGDNIKSAVVTWLTGNLGSAGIEVPTSFDARSLIGFALELVGLGLTNIKNIARRVFGRRVVAMIEAGVAGAEHIKQLFDILVTEGPAGLFNHLRAEFERMKGEVMEKIGQALAQSLIVAGIKKVLGILSGLLSGGAGTVVTIVSTIIDLVLWFRDNAAQLAELVSTIAGMAMAVLNGNVGALAGAVNTVLKRLLPVVLSFVGALVGIGGAVRKVQQIFRAIRRPATRAITALFRRLKRGIQRLLRRLTGRGRGRGRGRDRGGKLGKSRVRQLILQAMSRPAKATEPAAAIAETKTQASRLKQQYQPKLESGTIRIEVLDQAPSGVESDGDIDFSVALSPASRASKKFTVRRMPLATITFLSHADKGPLYIREYRRQLADQEAAINAMIVKTWRANRRKFVTSGRDSSSAAEQRKFRQQFEKKMLASERRKELKKLKDQGVALADAKAQADATARVTVAEFMKKNVALHDPDQIAGGSPAAIKRMGLKRVNSSIGSQWRSRAAQLTTAVDRFLRKNGDPKAKMRVKLKR